MPLYIVQGPDAGVVYDSEGVVVTPGCIFEFENGRRLRVVEVLPDPGIPDGWPQIVLDEPLSADDTKPQRITLHPPQ